MSGFNQQTLKYNVQNSNNVTVHIGDIPVAFGQTFTFATTFGAQNLYGVGAITPQEAVELVTVCGESVMLSRMYRVCPRRTVPT